MEKIWITGVAGKKYGLQFPQNTTEKEGQEQGDGGVVVFNDGERSKTEKEMYLESIERKAAAAQKETQRAMEQNPEIYNYDDHYDSFKQRQIKAQKVQELEKINRTPKYSHKIIERANQRKTESERLKINKSRKERESENGAFEDKEAFVTPAYRLKLEQMKAAAEKLKKEEEQPPDMFKFRQQQLYKIVSNRNGDLIDVDNENEQQQVIEQDDRKVQTGKRTRESDDDEEEDYARDKKRIRTTRDDYHQDKRDDERSQRRLDGDRDNRDRYRNRVGDEKRDRNSDRDRDRDRKDIDRERERENRRRDSKERYEGGSRDKKRKDNEEGRSKKDRRESKREDRSRDKNKKHKSKKSEIKEHDGDEWEEKVV